MKREYVLFNGVHTLCGGEVQYVWFFAGVQIGEGQTFQRALIAML